MQRLRKRPRLDVMLNQQRASTASWSRRFYVLLLALVAILVAQYLFADKLLLRAEGIVAAEHDVVAATYSGRIAEVFARPGAKVKRGDVLLRLESPEMLRDMAEFASRAADLDYRLAQLMARESQVETLLPLAERRAQESVQAVSRIDTLATRGLVATARVEEALSTRVDSAAELAQLKGEAAVLGGSIATFSASQARAAEAAAKLEESYSEGLVKATRDGTIGANVPTPGQVVKFGDQLVEVNGETTYILAFLPDTYLFAVAPDEIVTVRSGSSSERGRIVEILGVADALPPEFQNLFRPRDRSRLARVEIRQNTAFAISQKVSVTGCAFGWCWNGSAEERGHTSR